MTGVLITGGLWSAGVGALLLNERRHRAAYRRKVAQMEAQTAERLRQVRAVRAELEQAERGSEMERGTETIDCLEVWGRLPTRIPPHEMGRA